MAAFHLDIHCHLKDTGLQRVNGQHDLNLSMLGNLISRLYCRLLMFLYCFFCLFVVVVFFKISFFKILLQCTISFIKFESRSGRYRSGQQNVGPDLGTLENYRQTIKVVYSRLNRYRLSGTLPQRICPLREPGLCGVPG